MGILKNFKEDLLSLDDQYYEDLELEEYEFKKEEVPSSILKMYCFAAGLRFEEEDTIIKMFEAAYNENNEKAIKLLFFIRDRYYGLGERRVFRVLLKHLGNKNNKYISDNIGLIPEYGRYDDLYELFDTPLETVVIDFIKKTIEHDIISSNPTMLAKWLKSENTSSEHSRKLAKKTRKLLEISSKEYRLLLSTLRMKLNLIETNMSCNKINKIDFSNLTTNNYKKYNKALKKYNFKKIDEIDTIKKIYSTVNKEIVDTKKSVYPYDIVKNIFSNKNKFANNGYENMWCDLKENIYNYKEDTLVCMGISELKKDKTEILSIGISTVLYLLSHNTGLYKNYVLTSNPTYNLRKIRTNNIIDKIEEIIKASVTNTIHVDDCLDVILFSAIKHRIDNNKIPRRVIFISDGFCRLSFLDNDNQRVSPFLVNNEILDVILKKWKQAGYTFPSITFWNIGQNKKSPNIIMDNNQFIYGWGYSNEIFKSLLNDEYISSYDVLEEILSSKRYSKIYFNGKD